MAARTATQAPVGSTDWILKEFNEISSLCENELEDFTFSARNEAEWLNEHMADIFSSNAINLADIMKTPGKLRGKTPRTARQRSPLKEIRQPLGEIAPIDKRFNSPLRQSPAKSPIKLTSHNENLRPADLTEPIKQAVAVHDSGYHGAGDSMEIDRELPATQDFDAYEEKQDSHVSAESLEAKKAVPSAEQRSTESSFHSAKENQTLKDGLVDEEMQDGEVVVCNVEAERVSEQLRRESAEQAQSEQDLVAIKESAGAQEVDQDEEMADASSDISTPAKPVVRKSSLTFATLPAREPLATKKSMGNRTSSQNAGLGRSSYYGRITGGKSLGAALHSDGEESGEEDNEDQENQKPALTREESEGTGRMVKLHSKSSTQRLHERISALSKTQPPRPTKSIPAALATGQADYPVLPELIAQEGSEDCDEPTKPITQAEPEDDESWIPKAPSTRPMTAPEQEAVAQEHQHRAPEDAQTVQFQIHQDDAEDEQRQSTTPAASPPKHVIQQHGSLFASKSKLHSIMQSARGLFSSSAAASAQAKLEASSVSSPKREKPELKYPQLSKPKAVPGTASSAQEPRRTRSSTEKEEKRKREEQGLKETQEQDLQAREDKPDATSATSAQHENQPVIQRPGSADEHDELAEQAPERPQTAMGPPARPRTMLQKPGANRRPLVKPTKDQVVQPKVSIKIGSMAGRRPLTAASLSTASKGFDASTHQRPGTAGKKESTASQSTTASSAPSFKSSTTAATKPKALLAAERKREADEKAAQKKLEQKREMERRKQAQQEEAQRREQERQAAERQKERERLVEEERKKQEQRQAVEKKRAEQMAKREQMQREAEQQALKASTYRNDGGSARPPSRQVTAQEFPRPPGSQSQNHTAKGPKRVWNPEQDDEPQRARPQPGQNYQQTQEGKRRKTDEEEIVDQGPKRPTMAPPMRISNIVKNGPKASIFGSNYPRAPPPATHHYGQAQNGASQGHHKPQPYGHPGAQPPRPPTAMDIARFQNGAIPFAGANGSTAGPAPPQSAFKTPLQPSKHGQPQTQQAQQPKSSPFINGEYLHLDEIPTDSEEEDSEDEKERKANLPEWVLTPNLQQTLVDQETQNPDAVFGPIAPLNMDELFKDRKGQNRFRSRTSSANWFGADRLTEEEKVRDLEAREKIRKDGGWTFGL